MYKKYILLVDILLLDFVMLKNSRLVMPLLYFILFYFICQANGILLSQPLVNLITVIYLQTKIHLFAIIFVYCAVCRLLLYMFLKTVI